MPPGNRIPSGAALVTTPIWSESIGYDPHAPSVPKPATTLTGQSGYESYQGLLKLARMTGSQTRISNKMCKKCGGGRCCLLSTFSAWLYSFQPVISRLNAEMLVLLPALTVSFPFRPY